MKTKLILALMLSCILNLSKAQITLPDIGHQRGLYVNRFNTLISSAGTNNHDIDIPNSILGNPARENQLLQYCMENHFTYITLYSVSHRLTT